jgi:hypothetical protein
MSESSAAIDVRAGAGLLRVWAMPLSEPAVEALAIAALCPILLVVAFWNGFPLTFYDTGAYMFEGLGGHFVVERSPVYSLFLRFGGAGISLWWIAILQATMTAFVMVQTARALKPDMTLPYMAVIAGLLVMATGLPWYVGQIEPDCMTCIVVLAVYLLAFHTRKLGRWRVTLLVAIAAIATGAHPSHLGLTAGLALALAIYRGWIWLSGRKDWPRANIAFPAMSFVLGLALVLSANFYFTRAIFVSRAGPVFVFARLVQDGIAKRELDAVCPQAGLQLCAYKDNLPKTADDWLWGVSPFAKLKRFEGTAAESEFVVKDSLKRFPLLHLAAAAEDAATQFITFKTGDQIEPQEWILYPDLDHFIPRQMHAYMQARQQRGMVNFKPINRVHVLVGWLALAGMLIWLAAAIRFGRHRTSVFLGFILVALIGNAIICGVMSNPHNRYQSRLIWLPAFALAVLVSERHIAALRHFPKSGT